MDIHHGYEPWKSSPTSVTKTTFGGADWDVAKSQGKSAKEIADWARANRSKMSQGPKNIPGGGGLWDQIMAAEQAARSGSGGSKASRTASDAAASAPSPYQKPLPYENYGNDIYNNPADNPYSSSYKPSQHNYMNDPSTLSPDDLKYLAGTIQGLDDRIISPENPYSLLDQYIFNIKEEVNKTPKTKISTIGRESDDESDELYGQSYEGNPYDRYRRAITN